MFNRLRGKLSKDGVASPGKEVASAQADDEGNQSNLASDAEGFLCPMCMASMPGPAELQVHFEVAHSSSPMLGNDEGRKDSMDGQSEIPIPQPTVATLIDVEPTPTEDNDIGSVAVAATATDRDATDTDEVSLLQQELSDMAANLKEEKWYSSQLKKEHDVMRSERDQLEEEKMMIEEEYKSKLASAESGFLQVVEENTKLKEELMYADYKSQKERHAKLTAQIDDLNEKLETELVIKTSLQEALESADVPLGDKNQRILELESQLRERPDATDIVKLNNEIAELKENMAAMSMDKTFQTEEQNRKWDSSLNALNSEISSLQLKVKELTIEKGSKEEQLQSLQTALASSSDSASAWQKQQVEMQTQLISLQHNHVETTASLKEKEALLAVANSQMIEVKEALKNEVSLKQDAAKQLVSQQKSSDEALRMIASKDEELQHAAKQVNSLKEDMKRLELERSDLLQKIETGEGVQTAIHQLQQEKDKLVGGMADLQKENAIQAQRYELTTEGTRRKIEEVSESLMTEKEECKALRETENTLREDIATMTSKYEATRTENKDQAQALCDMQLQKAKEVSDLQQEIDRIRSTLLEKETDAVKLEQQIATISANLETEVQQKATAEETVKNKDVEIGSFLQRINQLELDLKLKTEDLAKINENLVQQSSNSSQQLGSLQTQFDVINEALKMTEAELNQKVAEANSLLMEQSQNQEEHRQQVQALQENLDILKRTVEEQSSQMEESSATIARLQNEHASMQEELVRKETTFLEDSDATNEQHSAEKKDAYAEIESLKSIISNLQESKGASQQQADEMTTTIASLEEGRTALVASLEQKDNILREAQSKLEVAQLDLQKQCESCQNYEIQLCRLEEQHKEEFGMIAKLKASLDEKANESAVLTKSLAEEQEKIAAAGQEWIKEKDELTTAVEEMSEVKIVLEARVLELDDELKEAYNKFGLVNNEKEFLVTRLDSQEESKNLLLEELRFLEAKNVELMENVTKLEEQAKETTDANNMKEQELTTRIENSQKYMESVSAKLIKEQEDHEHTKSSFLTIQNALQEEMASLQQKSIAATEAHEQSLKTRDTTEAQLETKIAALKDVEKKFVERISHKDVTIKSLDNRIDSLEKEKDEMKGDVKVLEAQLQNAADEKRTMLDRLLKAEEQGKKSKEKLSETNRRLDQALAALQELGQENQNLQVKHNLKLSRQWEDDSKATNCKKCDQLFSVTVRKHHCRHCGSIFCNDCSAKTITTPSSKKPVRVCEQCFHELGAFQQRRLSSASLM